MLRQPFQSLVVRSANFSNGRTYSNDEHMLHKVSNPKGDVHAPHLEIDELLSSRPGHTQQIFGPSQNRNPRFPCLILRHNWLLESIIKMFTRRTLRCSKEGCNKASQLSIICFHFSRFKATFQHLIVQYWSVGIRGPHRLADM